MKPDPFEYDFVIVFWSGGKDSLACLLYLLSLGVDPGRIELWHHEVDGREGGLFKMDWSVTPPYCRAVAGGFGTQYYASWKVGGFERELMKFNARTAPTRFETPEGVIGQAGGLNGQIDTRRKFPQVTSDLNQRWCSPYLKIQVAEIALRNQDRFRNARTLTLSGERAEESANRRRYAVFEPDGSDLRSGKARRHVDRWRPVHAWSERQVWEIIAHFGVNPHPAYHLGWSRVSCMRCIFGNDAQWASCAVVDPHGTAHAAYLEVVFDLTIHRTLSIPERVKRGTPYPMDRRMIEVATSHVYTEPVFVDPWRLPAGAYGSGCGPS